MLDIASLWKEEGIIENLIKLKLFPDLSVGSSTGLESGRPRHLTVNPIYISLIFSCGILLIIKFSLFYCVYFHSFQSFLCQGQKGLCSW